MRERDVEEYLVKQTRARGGVALKFVSPGCAGVPDRIIILPGGRIGFLELKRPGEKPRAEQMQRLKRLQKLGCLATWADSKTEVDEFLARLEMERAETDIDEYLTDILEAGGLL